ncbi:formimidoylglutamase [Polaribacter tangerinus]|uniref:formimidoylglutamase n=1 Tax=Polaribacter tangerinus TaxID=1920034 RepID=UPI000B4B9952|nr:formimidoylglutamase [Polaribacter tangerinus]
MDFNKELIENYIPGNQKNWTGRHTENSLQYWYQIIETENVTKKFSKANFGLIGYACDEGVRRNLGRVGAKNGPKNIRTKLAKIPFHFQDKKIIDFGDITCNDDKLENCQRSFSEVIGKLISQKIIPIGLGGGHDIAYANFNGIKKGIKDFKNHKIGILNFDAHFDLRKTTNLSNSGTPFYQILSENNNVYYLPIGIQQQSNTKELYEIAANNSVEFISNFDCSELTNQLKDKLQSFIDNIDYLYLTIDLDGFSSAYAPGVSAPSPLGFSPKFMYDIIPFILKTHKVVSCDIAELNPKYDIDNHTATLAARIIDCIVSNSKKTPF